MHAQSTGLAGPQLQETLIRALAAAMCEGDVLHMIQTGAASA
jgi:hypothetical protein